MVEKMKCPSCNSINVRQTIFSEDGEEIEAYVCDDCGWWGNG